MKLRMRITVYSNSISVLLLAVLCILILSPAAYRTVGDTFALLIIGVFLFLNIKRLPVCDNRIKKTILMIFCYIGIIFVYKLLGLSTASVPYHYNIVEYFSAFICFSLIYGRLTRKQSKFLLFVCIATIFITLFQNYQLKMQLGYRYSIQLYKTMGIAEVINTQYTSAILILSGVLFCSFLNLKHKRHIIMRYLCLVLFILCILFNITVTQRGIIVILSLIMLPLLMYVNKPVRSKRGIISLALIGVILIAFFIWYEEIFGWLGQVMGSARIAERFHQIVVLLQTRDIDKAGGSLSGRISLTGNSIKTFWGSVSHFIFGVGHRTESNVLVGNHSQLIDEFARFGVVGGTLSLMTFINMMKCTFITSGITDKKSIPYRQLVIIFIIFVFRSLLGSVFDCAIGAVLFIVLPLIYQLVLEERNV